MTKLTRMIPFVIVIAAIIGLAWALNKLPSGINQSWFSDVTHTIGTCLFIAVGTLSSTLLTMLESKLYRPRQNASIFEINMTFFFFFSIVVFLAIAILVSANIPLPIWGGDLVISKVESSNPVVVVYFLGAFKVAFGGLIGSLGTFAKYISR